MEKKEIAKKIVLKIIEYLFVSLIGIIVLIFFFMGIILALAMMILSCGGI